MMLDQRRRNRRQPADRRARGLDRRRARLQALGRLALTRVGSVRVPFRLRRSRGDRRGKNADLLVFDASVFEDAGTYDEPLRPLPGVWHVLVNGVFGVPEAVRAGRFVGQ